MGLIKDVFNELENSKGISISSPSVVDIGKIASDYLYHREIRETHDLLRRSCGNQINSILRDRGVDNLIVQCDDKYYKCIRVDMPSRKDYNVPEDVLRNYIPSEELERYVEVTRSYSYGYAQDVTSEMLCEEAERLAQLEQKRKMDMAIEKAEKELEPSE